MQDKLEDALKDAKKDQAAAQRETFRKERSIAKREKALSDLVSCCRIDALCLEVTLKMQL